MNKLYKSEAMAAVHKTALDLTEAGVMTKQKMREFDEICLTPVEEKTSEQIHELQLREQSSQAVFARHPTVTTGPVSQWGSEEKRPRGASLKPLS